MTFELFKKIFSRNSLKQTLNIKWGIETIEVYIAPIINLNQEANDKYKKIVLNAFEDWANATNGKIKFTVVDELYNSMINVNWIRVNDNKIGHCIYNYNKKGILYSAEVSIGLFIDNEENLIYDEDLYASILYLTGLSIGIPKSSNPDDIMYQPRQKKITTLSDNDKKVAFGIYNAI